MPTLNWIGKEKVVNHHQEVPYRILGYPYKVGQNFEPYKNYKVI